MAKKLPTSFRFSDEDARMLDELETHMGLSKTAVLKTAVRLLYRREIGRKSPPKKKGESP